MSTDDREYVRRNLDKMNEHCTNIAYMLHQVGDESDFKKNVTYQYAFTNALAQIGEHTKHIDLWLENHSDYDWHGCMGFRDIVDHHYSNVDYEMVWDIINEDIPDLMSILMDLRNQLDGLPDEDFKIITSRKAEATEPKRFNPFKNLFKKKQY